MNWRYPVLQGFLILIRSRILLRLREIIRIDHLPNEDIQRYQYDKLSRLLLHAYNHVHYYRSLFEETKLIQDGKIDINRFSHLPPLTKKELKEKFDKLKSDDINQRKHHSNSSGGSTGEPIQFLQDSEYDAWNFANKIYYKVCAGQLMGDPELRLWGSERDILVGKEKTSIRLRNWLYHRCELNAFRLGSDAMPQFIEVWNRFQPGWVEAYAQSLYEFAKYIQEQAKSVHTPHGIVSTAGTLYPPMRELIESVFQCRVYNRYGSREVGDMACNCTESNRLHLSPWNHYFEILDNNGNPCKPGEIGKVYITTLNNYTMPLIRYDIGDLAVAADNPCCHCGRGSSVIERVEGREMSVFRTRDGKIVPGEFFIHFVGVVFNKGFVGKFQVIQKRYDYLVIKIIVRDEEKFNAEKGCIEESIKKVMGVDCTIQWHPVDDIPLSDSGKYMYTISELD